MARWQDPKDKPTMSDTSFAASLLPTDRVIEPDQPETEPATRWLRLENRRPYDAGLAWSRIARDYAEIPSKETEKQLATPTHVFVSTRVFVDSELARAQNSHALTGSRLRGEAATLAAGLVSALSARGEVLLGCTSASVNLAGIEM